MLRNKMAAVKADGMGSAEKEREGVINANISFYS